MAAYMQSLLVTKAAFDPADEINRIGIIVPVTISSGMTAETAAMRAQSAHPSPRACGHELHLRPLCLSPRPA